jgi:NitT/TauT family transport system substrate-binding protein
MAVASYPAHPHRGRQGFPRLKGQMARPGKSLLSAVLAPLVLGLAGPPTAHADDKVSIVMGWTAEAEHGGIYQAVATGIYRNHGLDVTIRQGGPQVNSAQLLMAGAVDFRSGQNDSGDFNYVNTGAPGIAVAAIFQKDPTVLIAHPDVGIETLADLKGHPIALAKSNLDTFWPLLKTKFGLIDDQVRAYTFQLAPFLVDKSLVQLGFLTSEPYAIERQAGYKPKIFLIADDADYDTYASILECSPALVARNPDLVQRFVDASIEGWYGYLYGDPTPANTAIMAADPTMTADQIAYSLEKMKEYGIIDSGDSTTLGIGAMTDTRWKSLFDKLVAAGLYPASLDYKKAFTLQFVNKSHGLAMRQ